MGENDLPTVLCTDCKGTEPLQSLSKSRLHWIYHFATAYGQIHPRDGPKVFQFTQLPDTFPSNYKPCTAPKVNSAKYHILSKYSMDAITYFKKM